MRRSAIPSLAFALALPLVAAASIARAGDCEALLPGLILEVENQGDSAVRGLDEILHAVGRLTPKGGPGFLIVRGTTQDYAQVAGGDGIYYAEWRAYAAGSFRHWAAGRRGYPLGDKVRIPTNGAYVEAYAREKLSASEARQLLSAFACGERRPESFSWRDMTAEFQ